MRSVLCRANLAAATGTAAAHAAVAGAASGHDGSAGGAGGGVAHVVHGLHGVGGVVDAAVFQGRGTGTKGIRAGRLLSRRVGGDSLLGWSGGVEAV